MWVVSTDRCGMCGGVRHGRGKSCTCEPPPPPPYSPDLEMICYIEDPWHGPSQPRTWRCWAIFWRKCPHRARKEAETRRWEHEKVLTRIADLERELGIKN